MALKPRTLRRVILAGSLASIVILLGFGYFVVRPWQRQHQLDSMYSDGLVAAQAGDHVEATKLLGRYISRNSNADPEIYLAFSRSRLKCQASDGGHVLVAISNYREYLKAVPDDIEVSKELLPLFNNVGMYIEAQSLGESLRTRLGDDSIEVLREEVIARVMRDQSDTETEQLMLLAIEHDEVGFDDLFQYYKWLVLKERQADAHQWIASRVETGHDDASTQLIAFNAKLAMIEYGEQYSKEELAAELALLVGLDPDTKHWASEPSFLSPQFVWMTDRLFIGFGRHDLSLEVRLASARINKDADSMMWAARRLYWNKSFDELYRLEILDGEGDPIANVLGYQTLALRQDGDDDSVADTLAQLGAIDLDFRAEAWIALFEGLDYLQEKESALARPIVQSAIEIYHKEPVFHLIMGNAHHQQGRLAQARDEWVLAHELSNVTIYGNMQWIEPYVRIIDAYTQANRLSEVMEDIDALTQIAPNLGSMYISVKSYAALARSEDLGSLRAQDVIRMYTSFVDQLTPEQRVLFSPEIATLYASLNQDEDAIAMLTGAIGSSPEQKILLEILAVDKHYRLGVAQELGIDSGALAVTTPHGALRHAIIEFGQNQDVEQGLEIVERGAEGSDGHDAYQWALMRARYLDAVVGATDDPRAKDAWDKLRQENPDDIELLYQIVESSAYGRDIETVDEAIDQILEKTSTQGSALPSRLLLARAIAIADKKPLTKSRRDRAVEIVRGVVSSEQQNVQARTILGRLLEMQPSPALSQDDIFVPDFEGAVDQYVTISRQLKGRRAQNYLIQAVDLSFRNNDAEAARQYLYEFDSNFSDDYQILPEIARRLENLDDLQAAGTIYSKIYQNADTAKETVDAGLALANVYISQNQRRQANGLLEDLSNEPELMIKQLVELASLYAKNGFKPEADQIAQNGEGYGLSATDAKMAYAQYARAYISNEVFESSLREVVSMDSSQEDAWALLIRYLVRTQRFEDAQLVAADAVAALPQSEGLESLAILAKGDFKTASELIQSGAIESNEVIDEAVSLVDQYMVVRDTASAQELVSLLSTMLDKFENFLPVQRFALPQLNGVTNVNPLQIAAYGDRAARYFPGDPIVMRITTGAYLKAGRANDAVRVAKLWRANVVGSPMEADLAIAQGYIQLERYDTASALFALYIQGAIANSGDALSARVLRGYSHAQLMLGEDPQLAADRLEPLLSLEESYGKQVWLNLVNTSVPTHEEAARWLGVVTNHMDEQDRALIAGAWLGMIARFETRIPEYAQTAVDLLESVVASSPEDADSIGALARAHAAYAMSLDDLDQRKESYLKAVALLDRANELDSGNLAHLALGASYAVQVDDHLGAESRYRQLLAKEIEASQFKASIQNNLAMLIERRSEDADELGEALQLSMHATEFVNFPSFWGTRAWVELDLGQLAQAESSFQQCVDLDVDNLEGWVGLAIVQHLQGPDRSDDASQAFTRVSAIAQSGAMSADLRHRLSELGHPSWDLTNIP